MFDKAVLQPFYATMYADLCRMVSDSLPELPGQNFRSIVHSMCMISVLDIAETPKSEDATSEARRLLTFKKMMITRCQEEFERGLS